MKKIFVLLLLVFVLYPVISQDIYPPSFMIEINTGYSIGVNLDNAYQLDVRLYYPIFNFGVVLEAGNFFIKDDNHFHFFIAPMYIFNIFEKLRLPIAIGFDLFNGDTFYYGLGGFVAIHYSFSKNIYAGFNLGISYAFDNKYDEITGYRQEEYIGIENGQPAVLTRTIPIIENKSHFGNYIFFKPSIVIGFQF